MLIQSKTDQMSSTTVYTSLIVNLHTTVNTFPVPTTTTNLTNDIDNKNSSEHIGELLDLYIIAPTTATNFTIYINNQTSSEHITDRLDLLITDLLDLHTTDPLSLNTNALPPSYKLAATNAQITAVHKPLEHTVNGNINEQTNEQNFIKVRMDLRTNEKSENTDANIQKLSSYLTNSFPKNQDEILNDDLSAMLNVK